MNKTNHEQRNHQWDTITCSTCGQVVSMTNGVYLKKVVVTCSACRRRTEWHPDRKERETEAKSDGLTKDP